MGIRVGPWHRVFIVGAFVWLLALVFYTTQTCGGTVRYPCWEPTLGEFFAAWGVGLGLVYMLGWGVGWIWRGFAK